MKTKLLFSFCALLLLIVLRQPLQAQAWKLLGNSGTNPTTQFLGTADNKDLVLRTNNIERLHILSTGNVGIGTTSPVQKLDVNGNINMAYGSSLYVANQRVFTMDIGLFPLRGNLFAGASSGISNTTGIHNTASGSSALRYNTTGFDNTASGYQALYSNTIANYNTAYGSYALFNNGKGVIDTYRANENTAVGYYALYSNTTGNGNTASGSSALRYNTIGQDNTAIGHYSLYRNSIGRDNTAIGTNALSNNLTGNINTALGAFADVSTGKGNLDNATAIGYNAIVDASNKVRIGYTNVTSIGGQVDWTTFSDGRYKKNIKEEVKGLVFINSLRPITYTVDINSLNAYYDKGRKHDSAYEKRKADMQPSADAAAKIVYNGFIAQEVEAAAKKLDYDFSGVDKPQTKDGLYGLRYSDFVVPLVKAVQELSAENDKLKTENREIKFRLDKIEQMLTGNSDLKTSLNVTLSNASLEQNIPNPFNNSTTLTYTIPQQFSFAEIIITDKSGKILKEVNVTGSGKGSLQIEASTFASGAYNYSLYVDGRLISTKQMILTK